MPIAAVICPIVLGVGETLDVTNTGGAACTLYYSYYDIPDTNRTLVRVQFSSDPVTVIPAAATGFYNRWLAVGVGSAGNGEVVRTATFGVNDDTSAIVVKTLLGGVVIVRSASVAAQGMFAALAVGLAPDMIVTTDELAISTVSDVAARYANFMGCYETVAQ